MTGEPRYWYLAQGREDDPEEKMNVLSVPYWPEALRWDNGEGVDAPMLFTTREAAEEQRRDIEGSDPDAYLYLVGKHGEDFINEALNNALPYRVFSLPDEWILDKLEDSTFEWVCLDGKLKTRERLISEMRAGGGV